MPAARTQKTTFGDMREMSVRGVLIYCADYQPWRCPQRRSLAG
jgi:hypothetical protein